MAHVVPMSPMSRGCNVKRSSGVSRYPTSPCRRSRADPAGLRSQDALLCRRYPPGSGSVLIASGIDASAADRLTVRSDAAHHEVRVRLTVVARLRSGGLPADHGDVVVEARVAGAVVLREEHALLRERLLQIRSLRLRAERGIEALVLENITKTCPIWGLWSSPSRSRSRLRRWDSSEPRPRADIVAVTPHPNRTAADTRTTARPKD